MLVSVHCMFQIRAIVNDFAVMFAILTMVLTDFFLGIPTPKLHVPEEFRVRNDFASIYKFKLL